jgi:Flp pilus assembly protein CpaB
MTLESDQRAITLQMTDDALIDHCLNPDDRVDVLCVSSSKGGRRFTRTIATDARVLMCVQKNQLLARRLGNASANMVTLALTPDLAEAVTEAAEVGKIRLVLRNSLTHIEPTLKGIGPDDLLPVSALEPEKKIETADAAVQLPAIPPPPPIDMIDGPKAPVSVQAAAPPSPVQWIVEMFSGSHKESYGVPSK